MRDTFDFYSFSHTYQRLQISSLFLKEYRKNKNQRIGNEESYNVEYDGKKINSSIFPELLSIIIQLEDKDFFNRKKTTFSPFHILKRKLTKKNNTWSNNYNNFVYRRNRLKILKSMKKIIKSKNKKNILKIVNKSNVFKILNRKNIRGFSNIEQQFFRRVALKAYTYHYEIRRKIFIEYIYNKYFIQFYSRRKNSLEHISFRPFNFLKSSFTANKTKIIERRKTIYEIKLEILIYYYLEILKGPKNRDDLFKAISKECGQSVNSLKKKYQGFDLQNIDFIENLLEGDCNMDIKFLKDDNTNENIVGSGSLIVKDKITTLLNVQSSPPKCINNKIAYISPYDFETMNDIFIFDLKKGENIQILKWEQNQNPKYLEWKDESTLVVLLGETYGTIDIGGDIYLLDIYTNKLELIKKFEPQIQITQFNIIDNVIQCIGIMYIDDQYINYEKYEESIIIPS